MGTSYHFSDVRSREVLDKVAALTITRWNFKDDAGTPHIGPMAQDFYAAFGVGTDDKHIATVDTDGVAPAAIQGVESKAGRPMSGKCGFETTVGETGTTERLEQKQRQMKGRGTIAGSEQSAVRRIE